ncbi:MAG: transporter ATP-binding protein [Gammaproteobacteria bacterium]|jgi:ATP-binding cassette subfamily C protein|nr:transporter ATP-binding protein [Gammaproteobacteria bacterium]
MLSFLNKLFLVFDRDAKINFFTLVATLLVNSLLTIMSIATIFPFILILLSPDHHFISKIFPRTPPHELLIFCSAFIILAFIIKNLISFFCLKVQTKLLYKIAYRLSQKLFSTYVNAPYLWYLNRNTPDIIRQLLNECAVLANGVFLPLGSMLAESITSLSIIGVLFYLNPVFTLMVIVSLFSFISVFMYFSRKKLAFYSQSRANIWSEMTRDVIQSIGGVKETRIYELEQTFINAFNKKTDEVVQSGSFVTAYSQASRYILEAGMVGVIMSAITFMIMDGVNNTKILILLSMFTITSLQLLPSLNRFMNSLTTLKYSLPAFDSISGELEDSRLKANPALLSQSSLPFNSQIEIKDISFCYPNGRQALTNISLTIKKGQSIALVGFSGSGKTTLVDIILGLLQPDSGKILIDKLELNQNRLSGWRKNLAYIPQSIYLYDCSIKENVAFGFPIDEIDDNQVWQALEIASLKEFVASLPQGLDTRVGENGIGLSGGQRQRIGIARALFRNPNILILDEATNALDTYTEKEVHQAIEKASINRTIITIAHRLSTIKHSDVIYILDQGKIISFGSYDELAKDCERFQLLCSS